MADKAFNEYGEFLVGNIIIRTIEYGLFAGFIIHILDGLMLTLQTAGHAVYVNTVSRQSGNTAPGIPAIWD
jgi:hypothetical protein